MKKWSSHTVKSPTDVAHSVSHPMSHQPEASRSDTRTRAIFLLAAQKPPYHVYCNPFYEHAGYGNVFSVDSSGNLASNIQNYEYSPKSAIHGMVFDPKEEYLYSADMWDNKIWCHKKDAETGKLELIGSVEAPKDHDQPRWVAMHPGGAYLYALMEHGNTLAVYLIDPRTRLPVYTQVSYPLVPKCKLSLPLSFKC
jgi:carboxy-cis,cis-muconate cyclase